MLDAAIDNHDIARLQGAGLGAHRHLELAFEYEHHLLGVLVRVPWHGCAGFVPDAAEQHLLAADRVRRDAGKQR